MKLLFGAAALQSRSKRASAGSCVNFVREPSGESFTLVARPGMTQKAELGSGFVRGAKKAGDLLYMVSGRDLYSIDTSYNKTNVGTLNTDDTHISMSFDGTYIVIVDGTYLYTYNIDTDSFVLHADSDILPNPTFTVFSDGFHFINDSSNGQMATHETAYDPSGNWDALDFATAEYSPDKLLAMVADHGNVFMLGEDTNEIWEYDANSAALPLRPIRSAYMEYGIVAPYSATKFDNGVVWLARDTNGHGVAIRAKGAVPELISDPSLHAEWASYSKIDDAISQVWWIEGHPLWLLTFPTEDKTWVYDASSQSWSEFKRYEIDINDRGRHRSNVSAFYNGKIVCGDYLNGKIYEVSFDARTDNDDTILAEAESQKVWEGGRRIFHSRIELMFERGIGLNDSQGSDPKVRLWYSDDDGNTWYDRGWKSIGKQGEYRKRVFWTRLGSSRERIYRISMSDPIGWILAGSELEIA